MLKPTDNAPSIRVRKPADALRIPRLRRSTALQVAGWILMLMAVPASAVGLGQLSVQSELGQPLRASIAMIGDGASGKVGTCFNARLMNADGAFIVNPRIAITTGSVGSSLVLSTTQAIAEPALTLMVEVGCGDGIRREFSILLDPPATLPSLVLKPGPASSQASSEAPAAPMPRLAETRPAPARPAPVAKPIVATTIAQLEQAAPAPARKRPVRPTRSVLRLTSNDGKDAELINSIGLRLSRADRLASDGTTAANPPADPEKAAAIRAAQARFAAMLRDEPNADATEQTNDAKLQALQAKMALLESETKRLKLESERNAAAAAAASAAAESSVPGNVAWILGAVLLLSAGVSAWLLMRVRQLKQQNLVWDWEDGAAATDIKPGIDKEDSDHGVAAVDQIMASLPATATSAAVGGNASPPAAPEPSRPTASPAPAPVTSAAESLSSPLAFDGSPMAFEVAAPEPATAGNATGASASVPQSTETAGNSQTRAAGKGELEDLQFGEIRTTEVPAVEEISDVMQEAEFWISLRDAQRAAEVLEPYAHTEHPSSPLPWLYLFDLYAELGRRDKYDVLHERFKHVFNGKIPTWDELKQATAPAPARGIVDIPHIAKKIETLWPSEQILPYLESLLIDDRDGTRIGFDVQVYKELMLLIGIAYETQQSKRFIKPAVGTPGWNLAA